MRASRAPNFKLRHYRPGDGRNREATGHLSRLSMPPSSFCRLWWASEFGPSLYVSRRRRRERDVLNGGTLGAMRLALGGKRSTG